MPSGAGRGGGSLFSIVGRNEDGRGVSAILVGLERLALNTSAASMTPKAAAMPHLHRFRACRWAVLGFADCKRRLTHFCGVTCLLARSLAAGLRARDFLQHLIEREAAYFLARRVFLERRNELRDVFLRGHKQENAS